MEKKMTLHIFILIFIYMTTAFFCTGCSYQDCNGSYLYWGGLFIVIRCY